jgi:hypothetical protein
LTIFVRVAKFPAHQDEGIPLLTNLLIRGKVVSLNGDVVVENGKYSGSPTSPWCQEGE